MNYELAVTVPCRALERKDIDRLLRCVRRVVTLPRKLSCSIAIVSDSAIQELNRRYRGKNRPTDVLSFRYTDHLAEIVLSASRIRAQAKAFHHSQRAEAAFLFVHGLLHSLGWDHERSAKEAAEMRALEQQIIKRCGLKFAR